MRAASSSSRSGSTTLLRNPCRSISAVPYRSPVSSISFALLKPMLLEKCRIQHGRDTDLYLGHPEHRVLRGHADVADHREFHGTAEAVAVHGAESRDGDPADNLKHGPEVAYEPPRQLRREVHKLLDVQPGRERDLPYPRNATASRERLASSTRARASTMSARLRRSAPRGGRRESTARPLRLPFSSLRSPSTGRS